MIHVTQSIALFFLVLQQNRSNKFALPQAYFLGKVLHWNNLSVQRQMAICMLELHWLCHTQFFLELLIDEISICHHSSILWKKLALSKLLILPSMQSDAAIKSGVYASFSSPIKLGGSSWLSGAPQTFNKEE